MMAALTFKNIAHVSVRLITSLLLAVLGMCATVSVSAQSVPPPTDSTAVKAHVKEILDQPEFRPEAADSPTAQMARAFRERWDSSARWMTSRWNAFVKWFRGLFSGLGGAAGPAVSSAVSWTFVALFVGLGGWLVAWLIRNITLRRGRNKAKDRTVFDEAEADDAVALEPNAWIDQAAGYAESDDYRRAFRAVFIGILLLLDEGGLIEFDRARTNGDYLRLLRRKNVKQMVDILDPLVLEFDRRWYGRAETGEEDYKRIQLTFNRVRALMSETAANSTPVGAAGRA